MTGLARVFTGAVITLMTAGLVLPGCSGDSDDGSSGGASGSERMGDVLCPLLAPCCADAQLPAPNQGCPIFFNALPPVDRAAANTCHAELREFAERDDWCSIALTQTTRTEACEQAYPDQENGGGGSGSPTKEAGEACSEDEECIPPSDGIANCWSLGTVQKDTCLQHPRAAEGGECFGDRISVGTSLVNAPEDTSVIPLCYEEDGRRCVSQVCITPVEVGQPCTADAGCTSDYCGDDDRCAERLAVGAPCDSFRDYCAEMSYCAQGVCAPQKADGESCDDNDECLIGHCELDDNFENGVCAPLDFGGLELFVLCN